MIINSTTPPVPINLYVDRLAPSRPSGCEDIYVQYQSSEGKKRLKQAEDFAHLSHSDRVELSNKMEECTDLVDIPKHVDMTTGYNLHRGVYPIFNAVTHSKFTGYVYHLSSGNTIIFPVVCGNFEIIYGNKTDVFVVPVPPATVVTFDIPTPTGPVVDTAYTPVYGNLPSYNAPAPVHHQNFLPFLGLLFPIAASEIHTGGNTQVDVPPCSGGSNLIGACRP